MKLSDTALVMLAAAAQRPDRSIDLGSMSKLKGAAATRLIKALKAKGLIEAVRARGTLPVWRRDTENGPSALRITKLGLKAIQAEETDADPAEEGGLGGATPAIPEPEPRPAGMRQKGKARVEPPQANTAVPTREDTKAGTCPAKAPQSGSHRRARNKATPVREPAPIQEPSAPMPALARMRNGSKQAQVIGMLHGSEGTTVAAIMEATGWQPHSVRGFFAGVVRKRLGLALTSEARDGTRIYHLAPPAAMPTSRSAARKGPGPQC